ncbi:MAG TPA: DUF4129 domain-containing protein [Frankiaceae bacterium]|nr:DUF4129 domain-containing protein [Frankiaceae bacterium]
MLAFLQDPITRDGARDEAERELRKPIYRRDDEGIVERVIEEIMEALNDLIGNVVSVTPGGLPSLLLVVVALVLVAIALRLGLGPANLRDALTDRRRGGRALSPEEYRAEAERLAAGGDFKEAVRARFRAIIRELELRAVLDERPGRTAGEIAREGGAAVPAIGADLRTVAGTFDEIWYGRRPAAADDYATVRAADERIASSRLAVAAT